MAKKYVYTFGGGKSEGDRSMKNLLGGKGANLAEMSNLGIDVPAGFTISTEVCTAYYENNRKYPKELKGQVEKSLKNVEKVMGAKFGDEKNPLLMSVRSGARVSMPGMMDTVLNIGMNDKTVKGWIAQTGNERAGYDSYRRFVQMYGNVVLGVPSEGFEHIIEEMKRKKKVELDTQLSAADLKELVKLFKDYVKRHTSEPFPEKPMDQLWGAISAVFGSWETPRAVSYRILNGIPHDWGTAVNSQAMVFGNMGDDSATGVAFTRDPSTGEKQFFGEYLLNAQGEDVVAGTRTPQPINKKNKKEEQHTSLEEQMPEAYDELCTVYKKLEKHYRDMQDIEFTIQKGKLWMLQTRNGKRTGFAAVRIAVDMVEEKLITEEEALARIEPEALIQLLAPIFEQKAKDAAIADGRLLGKGLNAGPGAACGRIAFTADRAVEMAKGGHNVLLVRIETSPEDIAGMNASVGILTARGGMTSHAAVVARGMGKPCVAGCGALAIDYSAKCLEISNKVFREGEFLSIDGTTGEVLGGELPTQSSEVIQVMVDGTMDAKKAPVYQEFAKVMKWSDKYRDMKVRTNADLPHDASVARKFGAEGIGLCRTEHMFFEGDRITAVREMIVAEDVAARKKALAKLLPTQRADFEGIFRAMDGLPVTVRLLDPPLHEFVPHNDDDIKQLAMGLEVPFQKLKQKIESLLELNPMLGHRGCRLGTTYPEITEMQTRAIMEAACAVKKDKVKVLPEIMIPLVGSIGEMQNQKKVIVDTAEKVLKEKGVKVKYMVGTMIEVPRAALIADKIAKEAEFFSFGTNDLTQMTFGYSRDDAGKFLPQYVDMKILPNDPFEKLDQEGVGQLVEIAAERGRSVREDIKLGICGEHGGESSSVKFCHRTGLNYVSCSPYRVPVARLAAAQAVLEQQAASKSAKKSGSRTSARKTTAKKTAKKAAKKTASKPAKKTAKKAVKKTAKKTAKKATKKTARRR